MKQRILVPLLLAASLGAWPVLPASAEEAMYRVEVLVFRHAGNLAEPLEVQHLRGFHQVFEPAPGEPHPVPVTVPETGSTFRNLWSRLQRLNDYEPLALATFEQTQIDFHPPVRVHDAEVIAEELHFPGPVAYFDPGATQMFAPYLRPLYRLDGSVQLRRSRFLHLHLDLEYRLDAPPSMFARDGEELESSNPSGDFDPLGGGPPPTIGSDDLDPIASETEPGLRVHRLVQSRQVRTDTMVYFDTAYLGVLARVTAIAPDGD